MTDKVFQYNILGYTNIIVYFMTFKSPVCFFFLVNFLIISGCFCYFLHVKGTIVRMKEWSSSFSVSGLIWSSQDRSRLQRTTGLTWQ